MVVSGARAQYKGVGTVNGQAGYGFMLTAIDGQITGGGGTDKFRIKIWITATGVSVYDNNVGAADDADPSTVLGGGSIVIHKNLVLSSGQATSHTQVEALTPDVLTPAVTEAIARWQAAGLDETGLDRLRQVHFVVADLDDSTLGHAGADVIYVDQDAAGYGWFTDVLPASDQSFGHRVAADEIRADASSPAADHVDLLTLLMHEMGHVVGLDDLDPLEHPHDLMTENLSNGMRRLPHWDTAGGDVEVDGPASAFTSTSTPAAPVPPSTAILLATPQLKANPSRFAPSSARPTMISIPSRDDRLMLVLMDLPQAALSLDDLDLADHMGTSSLDSIPDDLISEVALLRRKQLLGRRRGR